MPTLAQFIERVGRAPGELRAAEARMVRDAALAVTTSVRAELSRATGGTNRLHGVGRSGAKLGAGFDFRTGSPATALVRARGPWQLIETDNRPHVISPKRAQALRTPAGPRASVQHPGSKGKHPWTKGVAAGLPLAPKAAAVGFAKAVERIVKL